MHDSEQLAAIPAVARTLKTLIDGTVRVNIDVEPAYREAAMRLLGEPGVGIAVARLTLDATQQQLQQQTSAPYSQQAKALRLSAFFRTPVVWRAVGSDSDYLAWLRLQKCAYCHAEPAEAAHVRRVANGAGTGIKPPYSAIPLCREHHALQHTKGESALGGSAWFDKMRIDYVVKWGWETLKHTLGYDSWAEVSPEELKRWAGHHQVAHYLPGEYR